jgi:hypothetical protein
VVSRRCGRYINTLHLHPVLILHLFCSCPALASSTRVLTHMHRAYKSSNHCAASPHRDMSLHLHCMLQHDSSACINHTTLTAGSSILCLVIQFLQQQRSMHCLRICLDVTDNVQCANCPMFALPLVHALSLCSACHPACLPVYHASLLCLVLGD